MGYEVCSTEFDKNDAIVFCRYKFFVKSNYINKTDKSQLKKVMIKFHILMHIVIQL